MDWVAWLVIIAAVFVGSYLQSVIGFGMALIVVAIARITNSLDFHTLTASVSLIALVNIVVALSGNRNLISTQLLGLLILGQLPAVALGLYALHHLSINALAFLEILLAAFLICGSVASVYRPRPSRNLSRTPGILFAGAMAGLTGGLFAASGPVMGWFAYRQPLRLPMIRATLLAFFAVGCISRSVMVAATGGLSREVIAFSLIAVPATVLGAWLGIVAKPAISDETTKKIVFISLIAMGVYIGIRAILQIA